MRRLFLAAALTGLAFPGAAMAAPTHRGIVLSASHRTVQVVSGNHRVHAFRYRGRIATLRTGSVISFRRRGGAISELRVTGRARSLSYYAKVVRSSRKHLVLRLADGHRVTVSARQLRQPTTRVSSHHRPVLAHAAVASAGAPAPAVSVLLAALRRGATVLVTESIASSGSVSVSIALPPAPSSTERRATTDTVGSITHLAAASVTIETQAGVPITFSLDPTAGLGAGFVRGDLVDVTSYAGSAGGRQAADIEFVESDATGTVSAASASSLTIRDSATGQDESFTASRSQQLFSTVRTGDEVDVTYHLNDGRMIVDGLDDITADNAGGSR